MRGGWWLPAVLWTAALTVCVGHYVTALRGGGPGRFPDLYVYRGAVEALASGGGLYDYAAPNGDPFTYPPVAAVLLSPLAWMPPPVMELAWFLAEVAVMAWLAVAVARRRYPRDRAAAAAPAIALLLAVSAPMGSMVEFGQVSIFILAAAAATVFGLGGGLPLGAAAAVKLLPGGAVPVLFAQGRRREATWAVAAGVALTVAGCVLLPEESARFWLHELPAGTGYGDLSLPGNQSVMGVLSRFGLAQGPARWWWLVLVAAAVAGTVRSARRVPPGLELESLLLVAALIVLVAPVSWTHHQLLLALAAVLRVSANRWRQALWSGSVVVVMSVNLWNVGLPGPFGWALANSRFLLAVLTLLVLPGASKAPTTRPVDPPPVTDPGSVPDTDVHPADAVR